MTTLPRTEAEIEIVAEVREGEYGGKLAAIEPGGAEFIPLPERHGNPLQLLWTWTSPNLEFATVFVGVLGVAAFGLSFWQATAALILGTALGSVTHAVLSSQGPKFGVPQMILSRIPFGYRGNWLPAGLNSVTAGIGWFAVNSVSGAFALNTLTHMPKWLSLLIIVAAQLTIAFFGHNLAHVVEKWALPVLGLAFLLAAISIFSKANASAPHGPNASFGLGGTGGFMLTLGGAFGYAVGWNPFASDYTRYMKPTTSRRAVGLYAGLGVFVSCVVLEMIGAASATIGKSTDALNDPTSAFTGHMSTALADFVLVAIAIGAVCANVLNIYSGAMSFLTLGFRLPLALRRAIVAAVAGTIGFIVALTGLHDAGEKYTNFLLVVAYWIAPWLGVMFSDMLLRRRVRVDGFLFDTKHNPWAGWVAMGIAMVVSVWLFSDQTKYLAPIPKAHPGIGDLTFEVGFILAALLYAIFYKLQGGRKSETLVIPEYGASVRR
ncbi:MAG TPA: cytosine permease [Acidothermaceae bacterium]|nr:cytosine permease [Acidothermaceae bacterium]